MTIDQNELQVFNLINQERSNAGLSRLSWHLELDNAAEGHSQDMGDQDFFDHRNPNNGLTSGERATAAGYQGSRIAENIGAGYTTPEDLVRGWMNSDQGHRETILNPDLEHIGVGYYYLPNDSGSVNRQHYWTAVFGAGDPDPGDPNPVVPDPGNQTIPLGVAPKSFSHQLNRNGSERVYSFSINETSSINLNLQIDVPIVGVGQGIGDDANLYFYEDTNGNGVFDVNNDQQLASSLEWRNSDDGINYRATPGTYFARVRAYSTGFDGDLDYNLDISATPISPGAYDAPNLISVPTGYQVDFDRGWHWLLENSVGDSDTVDTYAFSVPQPLGSDTYRANISLYPESYDADIRVIQDLNNNDIVDLADEVFKYSNNWGTTPESITDIPPGDYFLQVYQYSGNTNYEVSFDLRRVLG
ncbi:CAP domain-containing protein [Dapis sp. BLCC M172]|uniref:CAP domain-containing protein n=1 Tax=Dapis sp. BLCC M172 TaxID=2975281 RepID=UPI003CEC5D6C